VVHARRAARGMQLPRPGAEGAGRAAHARRQDAHRPRRRDGARMDRARTGDRYPPFRSAREASAMTTVLSGSLLLLLAAPAVGQGEAYACEERAPRTTLESVVAEKLPSLVKVHGASGLSTIVPYATGVLVSDRGH